MIYVTKHGNRYYNYSFKCPRCGCEFVANQDETETLTGEDIFSIVAGPVYEVHRCDCPECNTKVEGTRIEGGIHYEYSSPR